MNKIRLGFSIGCLLLVSGLFFVSSTASADDVKKERVYYLKIVVVDNTEQPEGVEFIHDAILTIEGTSRKLIQVTTTNEHTELIKVAISWHDATKNEKLRLLTLPIVILPLETRNLELEIDSLRKRIEELEALLK